MRASAFWVPLYSARNCVPLVPLVGYVTRKTGAAVGDADFVELLDVALTGNGSGTKAMFCAPAFIFPSERPQLPATKFAASDEPVAVACGNGRVVDAVNPYLDATSSGSV